jgi:4-hydroxybenzoate polyprenyltransferase
MLKLLRINHWIKNLYIFAPVFFSGQIINSEKLLQSLYAFFVFSLAASSIYVLNDIIDVEDDKAHPEKKDRPIASGKVSKNTAYFLSLILLLASLTGAFFINLQLLLIIIAYISLNILYSIKLKHIAIVDVTIIAVGFVLRVFAGGESSGVLVSHWLIIMTFLISLFLALAKRRDDLVIEDETGTIMRRSIKGYNKEFIQSAISILCGALIVSYILYVTSSEVVSRFNNKNIYYSTLFVILGVLRYLQLSMVKNKSGSPTKIMFKDLFTQLVIAGWILFFVIYIYFIN